MHKYRNDCFFSKFYCKRCNIKVVSSSTAAKNKEIKNSPFDKISSSGWKILKRYPIISYSNSFFFQRESKLHVSLRSSLLGDIFRVARRKLLISGDIELNPGPTQLPFAVLTQRLRTIGLRSLDIGGDGDCFFKAVSHQLCGTPDCHCWYSVS